MYAIHKQSAHLKCCGKINEGGHSIFLSHATSLYVTKKNVLSPYNLKTKLERSIYLLFCETKELIQMHINYNDIELCR